MWDVYIFFRVTQIKNYAWDSPDVILVGNKSDMNEQRQVTVEQGKNLADQLGNCCFGFKCPF
jgi:hypothetical protein